MLTSWFSPPAGSARSSADEGRLADTDDDTQVMEPDQGNGEPPRHGPWTRAGVEADRLSPPPQFSPTSSPSCGPAPT